MRPKKPFPAKKVFEIVDVGSRVGHWLFSKIAANPNIVVAAVDPAYRRAVPPGHVYRAKYWLEEYGKTVSSVTGLAFVRRMKRRGEKTKLLNFHMPDTINTKKYNFMELMREAPLVLTPNGEIHITSESKNLLEEIARHANSFGLKPEIPLDITGEQSVTFDMARLKQRGEKIYRLVIKKTSN